MGGQLESRGTSAQLRKAGHTCDKNEPRANHAMEGASLPFRVDKWLINTKLAPGLRYHLLPLAVMSPPHFSRLQISGDPLSWASVAQAARASPA